MARAGMACHHGTRYGGRRTWAAALLRASPYRRSERQCNDMKACLTLGSGLWLLLNFDIHPTASAISRSRAAFWRYAVALYAYFWDATLQH